MVNHFRLIFLLFCLLLAWQTYAAPQCKVSTTMDTKSVKTGSLVTMLIQLEGTGIETVNWDIVNALLSRSGRIKIIGYNAIHNSPGFFELKIVFTAIKPGTITINPLPIAIKYTSVADTVYTDKEAVAFTAATLPYALADIQENAPAGLLSLPMIILLIVVATGALLSWKYLPLPAKKTKTPHEIIRHAYLLKIEAIENQLDDKERIEDLAKENIFETLKAYINTVEESDLSRESETPVDSDNTISSIEIDKTAVDKILETSDAIRFSHKHNIPASLKAWLDEVKLFIKTYPSPLP